MNTYLFQIPEIERIIIEFLDPLLDYVNLVLVNKYFYDIVMEIPIFMRLKEFYHKKDLPLIHNSISFHRNINYPHKLNKYQINFLKACQFGYLSVGKYFLVKYSNKIEICLFHTNIFQLCCLNGHLETAKFLLDLKCRNLDIHANHEAAFRWSCENGQLEIVKWLYSQSIGNGNPIDIHTCNEYAFLMSCKNGHFDVVQYLYNLDKGNFQIHSCNNFAFRWSLNNGHLEIWKWLCGLSYV